MSLKCFLSTVTLNIWHSLDEFVGNYNQYKLLITMANLRRVDNDIFLAFARVNICVDC